MMTRLSIRTRLIAAYTLLFGVILSAFSVLIYTVVQNERFTSLRTAMESHAEKLHSEIEEQVDRGTFPRFDDLREITTEGVSGDRFRLARIDGTVVLGDSLLALLAEQSPYVSRSSVQWQFPIVAGGVPYARLAVPLEIEGHPEFFLEVAAPTSMIKQDLDRLRLLLILAVPLTLFLAGFVAAWIARAAFRPIATIIGTADRIHGGQLHARIPVPPTRDEIADLARTLNGMIARIDDAFESQQRFIADASHELKTPLTVIRSELEFALRSVTDPGGVESLQISLKEVDRLTRLAEGMLTLARLDTAQRTPVREEFRLDELLLECVQMMRGRATSRRLAFTVRVGEPAAVEGDPERIRGVILNLLDNAIKFSPEGETIACTLERNGDGARVTISDAGPGIPTDEIPKLFQRFYQSDDARARGEGAGLGLAIVDRIVRLHGGAAGVESHPGRGSRFYFTLPISPDQSSRS